MDERNPEETRQEEHEHAVAILAMAGRFPGARDLGELWENLAAGRESISFYSEEELLEEGLPADFVRQEGFVPARPAIHDVELFDAAFFDYSPREAEILDPQGRLFLEHAWEALERAGYVSRSFDGWIGVFAGTSDSTYRRYYLDGRPDVEAAHGWFPIYLANDRDYFTTRVSYKLSLRGPSINVQTACSTSLVAVHQACQALLDYQCDLALAGGAAVFLPQVAGYPYQPGGITSPDGHCRSFDARGEGSIFGSGVGVVVLKRLDDALADGDVIEAVLRGSAVNNDGSAKVGFTAPSIDGQAEAVAMAQAAAGVDPGSVSYVEGHGSATALGDPIEVAALKEAFGDVGRRAYCALGSVKSNFGHLEAASGIAGLIKTVLALKHRQIPPTVHFERPNPKLGIEDSPFFVNAELLDWKTEDGAPRRAGVSSFGMGGTNAHAVLEEAPPPEASGPSRRKQLFLLSARTATALDTATGELADHLADDEYAEDAALADAAYTLRVGRRDFEHRRAFVCGDRDEAVRILRGEAPGLLTSAPRVTGRPVAFLLPGIGEHYAGMGADLYEREDVFREAVDRCAEISRPHLDRDLRELLYPEGASRPPAEGGLDLKSLLGRGPDEADGGELTRTRHAHPAVFAVEYALAQLWLAWGVRPEAMIGHSLGEYVAATLAGVLDLEDVMELVLARARRIDELPGGAMLAVTLPESGVEPYLGGGVYLSAVNGGEVTVVAGEEEAVAALAGKLAGEGVATSRLRARHAFHSPLMEPAAEAVAGGFRRVTLRPPEIPLISNVTGRFLTDDEATDPEYWARHLCRPVRFADGLGELLTGSEPVLLEVGPGQGLGALALQHPAGDTDGRLVVSSLRGRHERQDDQAFLLTAAGRLWLAGCEVDWKGFSSGETRRRRVLPTYPFERRRYWIDLRPDASAPPPAETEAAPALARYDRPQLPGAYVAPGSDLERQVAEVWEEVLGVSPVGLDDGYSDLGGHSLLAPQLLLRLERAVGVELPVAALLGHPTVRQLAALVERVRREGIGAAVTEVDLAAEVTLADEIRPAPGATVSSPPAPPEGTVWDDPRAVFVTGGTGFLGAYLVEELLAQTGARLYCLARAGDDSEAMARLRSNLEHHRVWRDETGGRIVAVAGDLEKPFFGLSREAFEELAERVDSIYHGGAWVNFTYPYGSLKPSNVDGTREALRLAVAGGRVRPFHFVSSVAVFAPESLRDGVGYEDAPLLHTEGLFSGYAETKWVGEKVVGLARERGIPAVVYRPGVISGDSRTGVGNTSDMVWNLIKGCVELQAAFREMGKLDVASVDYVARAIVRLSLQASSVGGAFHFSNPRPTPWPEVFDVAEEMGYPVRRLSYPEWRSELGEAARAGRPNALVPFLPLFPEVPSEQVGEVDVAEEEAPDVRYDDRRTLEALEGSGVRCPPLDRELVRTYLDYFVERGFLERPRR